MKTTCSVRGCTNPIRNKLRRLCNAHYIRWRHYGKATAGRKLRESYSPTIIHGTITAYTTYCCRCDECREANTRIGQANKASRIARGIPDYVHGTNNGYISYGCRCDPCRQAASDYRNARATHS